MTSIAHGIAASAVVFMRNLVSAKSRATPTLSQADESDGGRRHEPAARRSIALDLLCLLFACLLAACGGGGGSGAAEPDIAITFQPTDVQVAASAAAVLSVTARGDVNFQWQRRLAGDWQNIEGGTSATLSLGAVDATDDGTQFRVIVTNRLNPQDQRISTVVTLKVSVADTAPAIVMQPGDTSVFEGQSATLHVTATGTSLGYRWQRSSDGTGWTDLADATQATLSLAASLQDDGALFRVLVSNRAGAVASGAARLRVSAISAPVFVAGPVDMRVVTGQPATFTATAIGQPAPELRWQLSSDGGASWTDAPGGATGSFTVHSAVAADDGKWLRAVAHNLFGDVFSANATLSVASPVAPVLEEQPADNAVSPGQAANFNARASGVPSVAYQWQVSTDAGVSFTNVNGAIGNTFTIPSATAGDDRKRFRVQVTNDAGSATSSTALLRVMEPPVITTPPSFATWRPGSTGALFTVVANGSELRYQWQLSSDNGANWSDAPGEIASSYLHAPNALATINAVRVLVRNPRGETSAWSRLQALQWQFVDPRPTGATLLGAAWLDTTTVVAVGAMGTILRSTDDGATWSVVSESADAADRFRSVAFDSNGIGITSSKEGSGNLPIKRSVDGGRHWTQVEMPVSSGLEAVAYNNAGAFCLAGRGGTILRSTDAGLHWAPAVSDAGSVALKAMAFNADGVGLIVGANGSILRSINGGANWARVATGSAELSAVAFATRTVAFAGGAGGALFRSNDAGQTWQPMSGITSQGIQGIQFGSAVDGVIALSQGGALVTSDGGATWTAAALSPSYVSLYAVSLGPGGKVVAVGEYGSIYRSQDAGRNWSTVASGGFDKWLKAVAFASASSGNAVGVAGRMLRSTDGGARWVAIPSATISQLNTVAFFSATVGVALGIDGSVVRTADGGASWTSVNSGTTDSFWAFTATSASEGIASATGRLYRTTDAGASWAPIAGPSFSARDLAFTDGQIGIAVGDAGMIYRTVDGGSHWSAVPSGTSDNLLAVTFANANVAIAAGANGALLRSSDRGASWQPAIRSDGRFSDYSLFDVAFLSPTHGVAVGTYGSVVVTTDGGLTWRADYSQQMGEMSGVAAAGPNTAVAVGFGGVITRNNGF